jgi:hypothetical protein
LSSLAQMSEIQLLTNNSRSPKKPVKMGGSGAVFS